MTSLRGQWVKYCCGSLQSAELEGQKKLRTDFIQLEDQLGQVRREYEMLRIEFEQTLTANEQTGELDHLNVYLFACLASKHYLHQYGFVLNWELRKKNSVQLSMKWNARISCTENIFLHNVRLSTILFRYQWRSGSPLLQMLVCCTLHAKDFTVLDTKPTFCCWISC